MPKERLDLEALEEAKKQREELEQLDISTLWKRLDLLIPNDPNN